MATLNRPDRFTLDAFSDPQLKITNTTGSYSRFTNTLKTPLLNVKGVQLINANFINAALPLNDQSQLMFFYYASTTLANMCVLTNLHCIRLLPSWFVPYTGFTAFTPVSYTHLTLPTNREV